MTKRSIKQSLQFFSILVIILSAQAQAQDTWYLNPGFKIGYAFGQNGGIIGGFEVSLTHLPKSGILLTGACVSVEKFKSTLLIHLGFEAASIVGASLGPTMMISEENRSFGFTATVWGGIVILPYFRYSSFSTGSDIYDAGTFLKAPITLSGPGFNSDQ